jgi:hypothetical protein
MNLKEQEDFNKPPYISSPLKNKKKTPPAFLSLSDTDKSHRTPCALSSKQTL